MRAAEILGKIQQEKGTVRSMGDSKAGRDLSAQRYGDREQGDGRTQRQEKTHTERQRDGQAQRYPEICKIWAHRVRVRGAAGTGRPRGTTGRERPWGLGEGVPESERCQRHPEAHRTLQGEWGAEWPLEPQRQQRQRDREKSSCGEREMKSQEQRQGTVWTQRRTETS